MKGLRIHTKAREVIREFSKPVRAELGSALIKLQLGVCLRFPLARPMPEIGAGISELRFRDQRGVQRVLYYTQDADSILVLHAFDKRTERTSKTDREIGLKRLREMLSDEKKE